MSVNDIINRHKKHLTNAQVHSLVKLSNEYKQLNAGRRAEAYGDLYTNHQDFRRGLQNMGLASRRGNIISGREVMGQVRVDDAYHRFNDQLNNIEDRMLDNAAGNMRAQNIARQQAQQRNFVDNLADQIKQQYQAKKEFNENAVDPRIGNMPKPTKVQPQVKVPQVQGDIDPRFAQPVSAPDKANMARIIPQARTEQRTANVQDAVAQAFDNANRAANPATYAALEVKYATKQKALADNTARWDREIADGDKIAKDDPEYKLYKNRAEKARKEKANAQSSLYRTQLAVNLPADVGTLVAADDADFAVRYDAAQKAAEKAQKAYSEYKEGGARFRTDSEWIKAHTDALKSGNIKTALEDDYKRTQTELARFEQAKAYRNATTPMDFYVRDIKVDESLVPKTEKWVKPGEWNGSNFKAAFAHGWEADDYAKKNDTKGSKYAALVNDWSLVNGRTALLYSQDFQVTKGFLNVADFFTEVIGKGGTTRDADHNRFLGECVQAYKGDYESSGTKSEKEQMDAMLTLANLMTDEERATFNTILNRSGASAADEYFKHLYNDVLPARFSEYVHNEQKFDTRDTIGKVRQSLFSVPVNLTQGVTGVAHTMTTQQDDPVAAMIGARKYNTAQSMRDVVSEDMSEFGKFAYGTGMSMADSMTVAAISGGIGSIAEGLGASAALAGKIGSTLGGSLLGGSAFNSAYSEALDRGLSPDKARATALGQGINEMLFEAVSLDLVVSQFQHGGVLKVAKNRWVNWAVNAGVSAGVEGSEELTTDVANELWDKYINGIYSEELTKLREYIGNGMSYEDAKAQVQKEFDAQLGMSFLGGAVSGGIMGGGASILGTIYNRDNAKFGHELRKNTRVMDELKGFDYKSETAQDILTQSKLTDEDVSDLFNIRQQELLEQNIDSIKEAVKNGTITQEDADLLNRYKENGVQIVKDGKVTENENGITAEEYNRVQEILPQLQNGAEIQFLNNEEMREMVNAVGGEVAAAVDTQQTEIGAAERAFQEQRQAIEADETLSDEVKNERIQAAEQTRDTAVESAKGKFDKAMQTKNTALQVEGNTVKVAKGSGTVTFDFSTRENNGKVTLDTMTRVQRAALSFAKMIAEKYGVNMKVVQESVGYESKNGEYNPETNTITVNLSGSNSAIYTMSHELTHWLKAQNEQGYTELKNAIKEQLARVDLTSSELPDMYNLARSEDEGLHNAVAETDTLWDGLCKYEKDRYAKHGIVLDDASVEEEVVARCCESFLASNAFVQTMAAKHFRTAKNIAKYMVSMQQSIAELQEDAKDRAYFADESPEDTMLRQYAEINRIANMWTNAVNNATKERRAEANEKQASIVVADNGMRYVKNESTTNVDEAIDNSSVVVDKQGEPVMNVINHGDGGAMLSLSTYEKDGRAALDEYLKKRVADGKLDAEGAEEIKKQMNAIYDICKEYEGKYVTFGKWSQAAVQKGENGLPVFSVIRDNAEYPMNLDFSLVCVKRRALDAVLNQVIRSGQMERLILDDKALVNVNEIIKKHGFETACAMCFVEAKRFRQTKVADTFVNMYNDLVKSLRGNDLSYFNFGGNETIQQGKGITKVPDSELNWSKVDALIDKYNKKVETTGKTGMNVPTAIAFELKNNPESRQLLQRGDFMSTAGFDAVAERAPGILKLYNKKKGTGGPKASFGDMQYMNDIETKSWTPERAYAVGGVRVQSFSDFVPRMFFDYAQMMADLAAGKLPAHAYTKEESFAKLFGLTGMKINLSLIPKVANDGLSAGLQYQRDKNGDVVYKNGKPVVTYAWAGESFNYDVAKQIQEDAEYGKNCGTICIGVSDEHIRMMMDDPTIRMIIPYHKSSLNPVVAKMEHIDGFTDYSKQQRTYKDGKAVKVDFGFNQRLHELGDPKAVSQEYLDWCKENGYTPKFEKFAYNADGSMNENYYKLLEDFSLYDEQGTYQAQGAVKMVYPSENSKFGSLDTILKDALALDDSRQEILDARVSSLADEIVKASDKWRVERQVEAAKKGVRMSVAPMSDTVSSEMNTRFSVRVEDAPTKTQDVYKLMRLGKDGRLYPLFIDSAEGIDVGTWYNADSPDMSVLKTLPSGVYLIGDNGKDIVTLTDYQRTHGEKSSKFPSKAAINSAANDGKRWVFIEDVAKAQRRYGGENRKYWNLGINGSGSVSTFAMRPGWHAGSLPTMRQIGKGANKNLRDDSFVWVKGRVSADVNYQAEAAQNPDNDIPTHIPTNGFYMKATNPNASAAQTDTVGWYIAGAFIADRIMSDSEARKVIDDWNASHPSDHVEYDWERESGGEFDAESMSIRNAKFSLKEGEERAIKIADGKTKNGETVSFIDRILDGQKTGETRTTKGSIKPNAWVGIYNDGKVYGRVKFGEPKWITKQSAEYKTSYIKDTNYDIDDSVGGKWYYPVLDVQDFRDNPIPTNRAGQWGAAYTLFNDSKKASLAVTDSFTESEYFDEAKYAKMSESERIEYRQRIAEMEMRSEARERQREIDRNRRYRSDITKTLKKGSDRIVKLLANPTEKAHVPIQFAETVAEYAMALNELLTKNGDDKQTIKGKLNAQKLLKAYNDAFEAKADIEQAQKDDPSYDPRGEFIAKDKPGSMFNQELVDMINTMDEIVSTKQMSELTNDDLKLILGTMKGVLKTVQSANKLIGDTENRDIAHVGNKMAKETREAPNVFGEKQNIITRGLNRYVVESLGLRRIAKIYSGSNENAEFVKLVDKLNQGAIEKERIALDLRNMFNAVTNKYAKDMKTWYGKNAEWIDIGNGVKITKGMRVALAMHILNEQNLRNIEKAGLRIPDAKLYAEGKYTEAYERGKVIQLTKAQAEQIVSGMTEAEKAYFEVAKEFFHKRSGYYINRTSLQLLGYRKANVENYFPIQTDDAYRAVKYDEVLQSAGVEHPGFLEKRKGTVNVMYLNDITAVVNRQIEGVSKYAGLAVPMRNWNAVMNKQLFKQNENGDWVRDPDGNVHSILRNEMGYTAKGKSIVDYVDQFIDDLTTNVQKDANEDVSPGEIGAKLTSNYVKAVLLLNARVAVSQVASLPTAAAEIPWQYIAKAFKGHIDGHMRHAQIDALIDQYTPIFAMRRAGTQNEIADIMKRRGLSDKAEQKLPFLLGWITTMDTLTTRRLWYACEQWVKGETKIPVGSEAFYEEVAKRYERVIQNTQPNFTVLQRAPILRSKNPMTRILTMFGTQRMQNGGIIIEKAFEVAQSNKTNRKAALKGFGRALSALVSASIMLSVSRAIVAALRGRVRPMQDEDKNLTWESIGKYLGNDIASNLAGSFMFGSEIYDFVSGKIGNVINGDSGYATEFSLPAAEALANIVTFFKETDWNYFKYMTAKNEDGSDKHTDHEKWVKTKSFINEIMEMSSYLTGLPLQNASKTILNGFLPLYEDFKERAKTGELNLYLHGSGRLDKDSTYNKYKEWTDEGRKGSTYLYWETKLKDVKGGVSGKSEVLWEDTTLSPEEKAILLRMMVSTSSNVYTNQGAVVYNAKNQVVADFSDLDAYRAASLGDAKYEGWKNAVEMGVPSDYASTAFAKYTELRKKPGYNEAFREWEKMVIKSAEQRAILEMCVIGDDGSVKRYEYGKQLIAAGMNAENAYNLIEDIRSVKKADSDKYLKGLTEAQKKLIYEYKGWKDGK